ncbi:carboxypeptidase regulatory-like domain-containing protein [Rossellomorea marisflavi]|uniref:carboxypeptidase regulatory-like domain-containing protein n=1 Tax=Rossellomorea marisflavi TaxID=189381 RepID=UPI00345ADAC6
MAFPSNTQFTPIQLGSSSLFDVTSDVSPGYLDIVGNSTNPAAFFAYDGTNVYFRLRLNGDPRNSQLTGFRSFSWGVLLNTTGVAGTYNWMFNVDGIGNRISLIQNTNVLTNSWDDLAEGTDGKGAPNVSFPIKNFDVARVSRVGSGLGDDEEDYYLDWFCPAKIFFSTLGINEDTECRTVFYTSTVSNAYNRDSLRTSEGFTFANSISNPVTAASSDVRARLATTKQLNTGPATVSLGQQATWTGTIRVRNTGDSTATTIFLQDLIGPDNVTSFTVNTVSQGLVSYNPATKQLTWSVGNLGEEAQATLTFTLVGSYTSSGTRLLDSVVATGVDSYSGAAITSNTSVVNVTVLAAATINGTIRDQSTGLVLPNTTVTLLQGATVIGTTTTNSAGFYSFTNLAAGAYTVQASRTNYTTASVNTTVSSGGSQTVNISLQPLTSTITGNVSSGGPIANATIVLTNSSGTVVATTTTNGAGNYTFTGVVPGSYNLSVTAAGFQSQTAGVTTVANQTSVVNFVLLANPGAVSGTVRDATTNAPIQGAVVELLTPTGILLSSTVTDLNGLYTFANLAPGSYQVRAVALGYTTSATSVQVVSGATTTANLFLQQNPGSVSGQVRDAATLLPIQGATVQAIDSQGFVIDAFTTNASGQYTFANLLPGSYTFVFTANGYGSQTKGATVVSNTTTILDAELAQIAGTLTGTITDPGSAPIPNATVTIFQNNVQIASVLTDASGNYTIPGLSPGSYTVSIGALNYSTLTLGTSIVSGQTTVLNATLTPNPGTLTGLVTDTGSTPLSGVNITVTTSSGTGTIVATTVTGNDGTYTIPGLAPGNYIVVASGTNFQQGSEGATITSGATTVVNFILAANPGSLAGTITNAQTGTPIPGANVQVRILDAGGSIIATVSSDTNGQYSVANLAPGFYTVVASAPNFQTNSGTVQVLSNQRAIGDVALVPNPGSIFGTITSSIGSTPIAGATVSIINSSGLLVTSVLTDQAGNFTVPGLAPDIYTVSVSAQDFQGGSVGAVVVSGQTTPVAVQLQPFPGRIIGTVTPEVSNAVVELRDSNNVFIDSFITNPDGTFSFNNLAPGVYTVTASAPNFTSAQGGATVTSGGTSVVTLTIIPNPATVSGRITTTGGVPLPTSFVQVLNANGILVATGSSDANGFYTVGGLAAGSYTVVANAQNYGQQVRGITLTVGQVLPNVDFVLTADTGNLTGQVTDRVTGAALSGASVVLLDATTQLPIATTTTSLFGNYVLNGLAPGTYIVTASLANYSTEQVGAIIISNQNSTANISLQPNPGTITGNVVDVNGVPVTGNNIQITVQNENNVIIATLLANPDGTYQIPQLAPGTYFVTATATGYSSSTVSAIVTAGQTVPVTNVLTPNPVSATARVLILGTSTPIAGSQVQIKTASNIVIATGTTDASGNVTFTGLPSGTLIVTADAPGFGTDSKSVFANPGDVVTVELFLPDDPGQVVGVVTNLATGAPLPNATITLTDATGVVVSTAVTNTAGQYAFTGVTPGTYRVTANATNFGPAISGVTVAPDVISNVSFALQPNPGVIQGIVRDSITNLGIPNATITVRQFSGDGPVITTTLTDANGFFQTTQLSPQSYVVIASKDGYGTATASAEVLSSQVTNVELFLTPNPGAVQGTIRDAVTGLPVSDTLVRVINNQGTVIAFVHTDVNGFYFLGGLPPSDYTITATNPLYQAGFAETLIQPNVTNTVNLSLQPNPATLSGLVFDGVDGSPLPGAVIEVRISGTNVLVRRVISDQNGRYIITGLPEGTFDVVTEIQNYMISTNTVFLTAGESEVLDIPLNPFPASLRGTVYDAVTLAPISGALVRLLIANTDIEVTSILTAADGTYTLSNIAAGQYDVIFSASNYGNFVVQVILEPNEIEVVDAFLDPNPATLRGRVFNLGTGANIQGALVRVFNQDGIFITSTLADADGIYELPGIAEGLYTVIYSADGFGAESRTVALPAGATVTVDVGLIAESSALEGTVRDAATGLPIAAALVQVFAIGTTIPIASVQTDQFGRYFISGLLPEEYRVVYSAPTYQSETFILFFNPGETKTVDADLTRIPSNIQGVVTDLVTGLPIGNATVILFLEGTEIVVASTTTDQDGNYVLTGLSAGNYSLRFEATGYQTASVPVQLGFAETLTINQALRLEFGSVIGTIREALTGEPIRNALVIAFSLSGIPLGNAITDVNGNYLIDGLPAGPVVLIVRATGFQTQMRDVTIIGGETIQENFNLLGDPAVITGFITDIRTGEPIPQALVQIYPFGSDVPIRSTLSTQNGFYILFGLPPGRYVIRVRAFGYPEKFVEVTLLEGQVLRLDIQLGNVNPPPPNDLRPECIKADKLYDWVFAPFRESQKVMIPPDCRAIVEDALALGEDVTISCSTGAASCRVIGYENGRPGVVNVRIEIPVTLTLETEDGGSCVIEYRAYLDRSLAVCIPDGLNAGNIDCSLLEVKCMADGGVLTDQFFQINLLACLQIEVHANVTLEVLAEFCFPRGNPEFVDQDANSSCDFPEWPPSC